MHVGDRNNNISYNKTFFRQTFLFFQDLGVYCAKGTPVPIPNTEVKLRNVDGTAWLHVGE